MKRIILASASPRRKALLSQIGITFEIMISDSEQKQKQENNMRRPLPEEVCVTLAEIKAKEVAERAKKMYPKEELLVIGADTVVALGETILGKPEGREEAREMLMLLSGKGHRVYTGVAVVRVGTGGDISCDSFFEETAVEVAPLSKEALEAYLNTGESRDKAGAYGIQGVFARHIVGIEGDYYNVMGLPVGRLYRDFLEENVNVASNF